MAAPEASQVSSLPLPPMQYIQLYSEENIRRNRNLRPPPPIQDNYSMFGNAFNADDLIIRPLESQGFKRLYPQHFDRRRELRKLNHSLLVNFLDLLDLLVMCPDSPRRAEKVEDLNLLFIHIHHLLNEFRPHQVHELLQQALHNLPDSSETDSKLLVPTEAFEDMDTSDETKKDSEAVNPLDRLMCDIVDNL
ncbi:Mediator of RNA polymerase II transcription subunit 7 [Frankliniella fusca]|uniref:Mediator of RNA polymerase II transcription subunit 7 n=1 Tax=Frankliniella fusca TaxID=407009 RepID=A0AAE1HZI7_9NEOP|nr:Mediator of RNA polymerase II transcription subunit 7 [Frankliniella fusca]